MCRTVVYSFVCVRLFFFVFVFVFFFSSRRRHTSYIGDWSSDVCSSDLQFTFRTAAFGDVFLDRDKVGNFTIGA